VEINGKTKTVALIGDPVEHSFSPFIHNYGFESNNLNMVYINHNVKKKDLKDAIMGIKALGYIGANITYPHKIDVINYLDEITKEAELIGAVNTIKNEDGKLKGYNTDGLGFVKSIIDSGHDIRNKNVMILGAGGGARSIAVEIASNKANSITIRNRSINKAKDICNMLNENFDFFTILLI